MSKKQHGALRLDNLKVEHNGKALFTAVSIDVLPGQILTVMGGSGSGKSSLLSAIAGTLPPELQACGNIYLAGREINSLPVEQRGVGLQYQDDLLFPHLDVAGNLLFALAKGDRKQRLKKVSKALSQAGMDDFAARDVATLSGGQRARVSLLRTLLAEPKLILLDEPFSRLDQKLRQDFRRFVYQQIEIMSVPGLLVSHDEQDCVSGQYYDLESGCMHSLDTVK